MWWEYAAVRARLLGDGVPRFVTFVTQCSGHSALYRHVNVVEMQPSAQRLPTGIRDRQVRRVLLRTRPLVLDGPETPGIKAFTRAERCVAALNRMDMAIKAAEIDDPVKGVNKLFDYLWQMEDESE